MPLPPPVIRVEQLGDEEAIRDLTAAAFAPMPYSNGSEASIIAGLRAHGDLAISLVAVDSVDIIGPIAFSPVTIGLSGSGWYGLGPVSVRPDRQRQGIGGLLIRAGLAELTTSGATGCALIGDPNYYRRFGFRSEGRLSYGDLPPKLVQWLTFQGEPPRGRLIYRPAFGSQS